MTGRDLDRNPGHEAMDHEGHQVGHDGHGGHHWMMMACCVPMVVIVLALVATGTVSVGFILFAVLCVGMMALMMRGMDHGSGHAGH
ncbi:MAG: hypothetical protein M0013_05090 [Actinomycetota bacterium]|nr:hypothetical protein [Actinomycetota bacterium]